MRSPMPVVRPEEGRSLRLAFETVERLNRSYAAAQTDNYTADFKGTYGAPNSEMLSSGYQVRSRARTLAKDTHAKAVVRSHQNNTVGPDPFKLEMKIGQWEMIEEEILSTTQTANEDGTVSQEQTTSTKTRRVFTEDIKLNQALQEAWREYCLKENFTCRKTMDFMQAMRVVESEEVTAGAVICRLYAGYEFNEFGFAVDFLETERLQDGFQGKDPQGNPIRFSISWHPKYNFPITYWILSRHPGEVFGIVGDYPVGRGQGTIAQIFREPVPAREIIHFNNLRDRAEQDIGFTELDATILPLWRLQQYEKSLALSSIASAAKPWWLEKALPTGLQIPNAQIEGMTNAIGWTGPEQNEQPNNPDALEGVKNNPVISQQNSGNPTQIVTPATREELPPGYVLKQADPKFPIEAAHEFRQDQMRDIASITQVPYQHVSGDYQNLGFIAGLMCMIAPQDNWKCRQNNIICDLRQLFEAWLKATIISGYFDKRGVDVPMSRVKEFVLAAHFKGRRWPFVNPLVQAQALILLNEAGHLTRQQVQDELPNGMSFERLVEELEAEKDELDQRGLNLDDIDVTRPTISKGEPGQVVQSPQSSGGAQKPTQPKSKVANPLRKALKLAMEETGQPVQAEVVELIREALARNDAADIKYVVENPPLRRKRTRMRDKIDLGELTRESMNGVH